MLVVEPADRKDVDKVHRLAAASLSERYSSEWIASHIGDGDERILVAREVESGDVLGFALARREAPCECHLLALAVDGRHRGRGIGSTLLRQIGQEMLRTGAHRICLEVRADDRIAQSFYLRHGFHPEGLDPNVYSDGVEAVRLARPL